MRKSFMCNLLTSHAGSTEQYLYRAAVCRQARAGLKRASSWFPSSDRRLAHLQPVVLGATLLKKAMAGGSITTSLSKHLLHAVMWMLAQQRTGAMPSPSPPRSQKHCNSPRPCIMYNTSSSKSRRLVDAHDT